MITSANPLRGQTRNRMTCCEICSLRSGEKEREQRRRRRQLRQCQQNSRHYEAPTTTTTTITRNSYCRLTTSVDLPDIKKPHNCKLLHRARFLQTPIQRHKTVPKLNKQLNGLLAAASSLLVISFLLTPVELVTSIDRINQNNKTNIYSEVSQNNDPSTRSNNVRQVGAAGHGSRTPANDYKEQEVGLKSDGLVCQEAGGDLVPKASDARGDASPRDNGRVSPKSSSTAAAVNQIRQSEDGRRQRARRSWALDERYATPGGGCADCLAIPVVAGATSTGTKQQNLDEMGFSSQGPRYLSLNQQPSRRSSPDEQMGASIGVHKPSEGRAISRRQQQHQQQQSSDRDPYSWAAARVEVRHHQVGAYQHQTGLSEGDNHRRHQNSVGRPVYRKSYTYKHHTTTTTAPPLPFEPKSDEKCPMTGHMTVCDQIGSYPADVILTKLEGAKMMLGQTYFNLDSLFSDESQHSSDPFEADKPKAAAAAPANNSSAFEESNHHATQPKTNIDHCAHQSEPDTHYGGSMRSSAHGDDANVNKAPSGSQITTPTGATEPVDDHLVSSQARLRQQQRLQRTYDDGQAAPDGHFLGDTSQIMSGQRKPTSGKRSVLQQGSGVGRKPKLALLNDPPAETIELRRQGPNSLSPVGSANKRSLQLATPRGHARASTQSGEPVDEFLYLVERRGVRLEAPDRRNGGPNWPDCDDKLASNLRHPDLRRMKVYQTKAPQPNDHAGAGEHNDSNGHDQLANYIGAPADAVAALASTVTGASSPAMPSAQLNSHNMAKGTLASLPMSAADAAAAAAEGDTSGLKMASDTTVITPPPVNTNTTLSGRRKAIARRRVVGQPYGFAASDRGANDEIPRLASRGNQKRPPVGEVPPRPGRVGGLHMLAAPRDDLDLHWPGQRQITLATASNEQGPLDAPSQLNEPQELRGKFASRTRRQVPITIDSGDRSSRIDPERVEAASREPGEQVQTVCAAKSIYISPRAALNDKKQWKYVVNAAERDPRVKQIIRVDICQNPFGPCSGQVSLPFGFTSQCKQKYAKKKLLALDSRSGLLEVDTFFIPSCCVCQLILDTSRPNDSMTPIGQEPPPQPISSADQDNGDGPAAPPSDEGATEASAP